MPRPGGHVHQNAGLLGCQDRLHLEVAAGLQRKDRSQLGLAQAIARSQTGATGQRHGGKDKSCVAPLEQHMGWGFQER